MTPIVQLLKDALHSLIDNLMRNPQNMRSMASLEAEVIRKILFERALEMKKAIAHVRVQESRS